MRNLSITLACCALCACATSSASNAELLELKAAVRALREDNARLESKISRLEQQRAVAAPAVGRPAAPAAVAAPAALAPAEPRATADVPSLTVVKLKPKKEAAPKINTEVDVLEPSPEVLAAIKKIEAENRGEPSEPEEVDPEQGDKLFEKGLDALKTGNVSGGVEALQKFAAAAPKHAKADNALYFSGVGLMGLSSYEDAARTFEEVASRYPAGDAVQDSMLKLAECRIKLNKPQEARAVYQKIVSRFPGTAAASQAQGRLTQLR
ncbi:MAG: tetratricopeptide repeat protein [Archangiaceae bacterium]|nr:tetratricopeptide repeat protein [Archangiaceae bacterium]